MYSIKKITVINIFVFAALFSLAKWHSHPVKNECTIEAASASLPDRSDFSIVNMLSLKFR